jgi:hypothetical protein
MNYELARKLKNAGFVQKEPQVCAPGTTNLFSAVYYPTLSELIEACGNPPFSCSLNEGRWFVNFTGSDDGHGNVIDFWLPTLEEVFAMYWLELKARK